MKNIDPTKIEIISKELGKIADSMNHPQNGMSSGEVAILAATIGALTAIVVQLIVFFLTRYKEKESLKKELIAEERRISYLITEYYKEFVSTIINKNYWYRVTILQKENPDPEKSKNSYERHFIGSQKNLEAMEKIRVTTSEYFKTVTHYTNLVGKNKIIESELKKIKELNIRPASLFEEAKNYPELMKVQEKENEELNKEFTIYSVSFDKIFKEMEKKI